MPQKGLRINEEVPERAPTVSDTYRHLRYFTLQKVDCK